MQSRLQHFGLLPSINMSVTNAYRRIINMYIFAYISYIYLNSGKEEDVWVSPKHCTCLRCKLVSCIAGRSHRKHHRLVFPKQATESLYCTSSSLILSDLLALRVEMNEPQVKALADCFLQTLSPDLVSARSAGGRTAPVSKHRQRWRDDCCRQRSGQPKPS